MSLVQNTVSKIQSCRLHAVTSSMMQIWTRTLHRRGRQFPPKWHVSVDPKIRVEGEFPIVALLCALFEPLKIIDTIRFPYHIAFPIRKTDDP